MYWSGLAFPSPGDLPNPGIKPHALQADSYYPATREAPKHVWCAFIKIIQALLLTFCATDHHLPDRYPKKWPGRIINSNLYLPYSILHF